VHFLRFELSDAMVAALRGGARLSAGIDHANYTHAADSLPAGLREALIADLA
jgi:hypothetical protein